MKMILAMILLAVFARAYGAASVSQVDCSVLRPGFQKYEVNFVFNPAGTRAFIQFDGRQARGVFHAHFVDMTELGAFYYATLFSHDNRKMTFEFPRVLLMLENSGREFQVAINHGEFFGVCSPVK